MKWFPPRWRIKIYGMALAAGALFSFAFWLSNQPSYRGKSLEWWLEQANQGTWDDRSLEASSENITQAVQHIGERAIPTLLTMLKQQSRPWKDKLETWTGSVQWLPTIRFRDRTSIVNGAAMVGFGILKEKASPAFPELRSMLQQTHTCERAAGALQAIGPRAIPLLLEGVTNKDPMIRSWSTRALSTFGTNATTLRETMWVLRKDTNELVAYHAWCWLFLSEPETQQVQMARETLSDGRRLPVNVGLTYLSKQGPSASNAVPEITNLLTFPNRFVQLRAARLLKNIDPVAAAAFGIDTNPPSVRTNFPPGRPRRAR